MVGNWGKAATGAGVLLFVTLAAVGGAAGLDGVTRPAAVVVALLVLVVAVPAWAVQAVRARRQPGRHGLPVK